MRPSDGEGLPREGRGPRTPVLWPLVFVVASLLSLSVSPFLVDRRIRTLEAEISQVLDPARDLSADLVILLARQMSLFES